MTPRAPDGREGEAARTPSDARLVAVGAASGLIIAMPAALTNVVLVARDPRPVALVNVTLLGLALGFALAGFTAAREVRTDRHRRGVIAALGAFVPVEVVGILARVDRGAGLSVGSILLLLVIALAMGSLGARVGARRSHPGSDEPPDGPPAAPAAPDSVR